MTSTPTPPGRLFSNVEQLVRDYILGKYQGDSAVWQERFGQAKSLREVLDIMQRDFPEAVPVITKGILASLSAPAPGRKMVDPKTGEVVQDGPSLRVERKQQQMVNDGIVLRVTIPDGIPLGLPGFKEFLNRDNSSVKAAKKAVQAWAHGVGTPLLTLAGVTGTGKSHLAMAAATEIKELGKQVVFRPESNMMGEIHAAMKDGGAEEIITQFEEIPYLVLDELGVQAISVGGWDDTVRDRIINSRWRGAFWGYRTLVTTNLLIEDLPARMASRLGDTQWGKPYIKINATDYRRQRRP